MSYETVFDISAQPFAAGPVLLVMGTLLLIITGRTVQLRRKGHRGGVRCSVLGMLGLATVLGISPCVEQAKMRSVLASGNGHVVEGEIAGYWTNRAEGAGSSHRFRTYETFRVDDVRFEYYWQARDVAFHNGGAEPVAIANGTRVRIHYAADPLENGPRNRILKLELVDAPALASVGVPNSTR